VKCYITVYSVNTIQWLRIWQSDSILYIPSVKY